MYSYIKPFVLIFQVKLILILPINRQHLCIIDVQVAISKDVSKMPDDRKKEKWEEDIDDEELQQLVLEAQAEALLKAKEEKNLPTRKRPFPKWIFYLMALVLFVNTFGIILQVYSIPAIEFVKTSARLSAQENIAEYKKSVVVVLTDDSKGTGFSITENGTILTNYHVIEDKNNITVGFPDDGRFRADVIEAYPEIDLAVLQVSSNEDFPYLTLAEQMEAKQGDPIIFIGNPLRFTGIANEGTLIEPYQLSDWDVPIMMMEAPVYRGNSGSPVFNQEGLVIGIVFATLEHESHGKVGLFVPIEEYYKATTK